MENEKFILTNCEECYRHFGVEKSKYMSNKDFVVKCPYCKKVNTKKSFGRELILLRDL